MASSFLSVFVILCLFLTKAERRQPLLVDPKQIDGDYNPRWQPRKIWMAVLLVLLLVLWSTEQVHGFHSAFVVVLGAMLVTAPLVGIVNFKDALKNVSWTLIIFMAATIQLGEALIESGAAEQLMERIFAQLQSTLAESVPMMLIIIATISLLSHLVITSRTARASVLVPLIILAAVSLGYTPTAIAFMATAALGFCLTMTVSAKPLAMFSNAAASSFTQRDLLKLSGVLLPLHLSKLRCFSLLVWPAFGLTLAHTDVTLTTEPKPPTWEIESPVFNGPATIREQIPALKQRLLPVSTSNENLNTPANAEDREGDDAESDNTGIEQVIPPYFCSLH